MYVIQMKTTAYKEEQMNAFKMLALNVMVAVGLIGCDDPDSIEEPHIVNELQDGDIGLHIDVTNQSFDLELVDLDVFINEIHVIAGDFHVGDQHEYYRFDFLTTEGTHTLRAVGDNGGVVLEEEFEMSAETWGNLSFWYYADGQSGVEPTPKSFTWNTYDFEPMYD